MIERFLLDKVGTGREDGYACAGDIIRWCRRNDIIIPSKLEVRWVNIRIADAIACGIPGYRLVEKRGLGKGVNFWWEINEDKTDSNRFRADRGPVNADARVRASGSADRV